MYFGTVVLGLLAAAVLAIFLIVAVWRTSYRRPARRAGYDSVGDYLRAVPQSDEEKRDAVDLALKGVVVCLLSLFFPPLLIVGLFPLFHGARKIAHASMGLGLIDDADPPTP